MRRSGPNIVHLSGSQATAGGFTACHDASRRPQPSVPSSDTLPLRSASTGRRHRGDTQASTALDLLQPAHGPRQFCGGVPEFFAVSIHAPARGATSPGCRLPCAAWRFNPRAREAARQDGGSLRALPSMFQSTAREGRDPELAHVLALHARVSIHAPARGATRGSNPCRGRGPCFNPRAREGRDCHSVERPHPSWSFNPRAREGRDARMTRVNYTREGFQSTRPRGARPGWPERDYSAAHGFNPRAREGRDARVERHPPVVDVSIHAPARGATLRDRRLCDVADVSIHAPARGATVYQESTMPVIFVFQSTRPRGARQDQAYAWMQIHMFQSTRPRGARRRPWNRAGCRWPCFNPRAREGRDSSPRSSLDASLSFQSTRPRGARQDPADSFPLDAVFQSTRPRGARPRGPCRCERRRGVSIHAPARGATRVEASGKQYRCVFQSTRPRGARPYYVYSTLATDQVSIHAPARGATRSSCGPRSARSSFNPRAREGRDQRGSGEADERSGFNPRAREGRDGVRATESPRTRTFQSTRPRGARREYLRIRGNRSRVSIHAPARGATRCRRVPRAPPSFQSTRPRGARLFAGVNGPSARMFQSTRPRGARRILRAPATGSRAVSIHAPARGATMPGLFDALEVACFNPRAREGRDSPRVALSTSATCFNPRAREGRDPEVVDVLQAVPLVSIHAPARGATDG